MKYTPQKLKQFEKEVVEIFNDGQLKSPIHLSGSKDDVCENELIKIFKDIKPNDWVFSTYRSHYHALLKGIPEEWLKNWILDNKSIHVMNKEHKFFTSAIVAGCLSIALGVAMAIKKRNDDAKKRYKLSEEEYEGTKKVNPHVWVFIGDMTASLGTFQDCTRYAAQNDLPITFIIEDNNLSTDTVTEEAWGSPEKVYDHNEIYYKYERIYPHYGSGQFVKSIWKDMEKEDVRVKGF